MRRQQTACGLYCQDGAVLTSKPNSTTKLSFERQKSWPRAALWTAAAHLLATYQVLPTIFFIFKFNAKITKNIKLNYQKKNRKKKKKKPVWLPRVRRSSDWESWSWLVEVCWAFESNSLMTVVSVEDSAFARASDCNISFSLWFSVSCTLTLFSSEDDSNWVSLLSIWSASVSLIDWFSASVQVFSPTKQRMESWDSWCLVFGPPTINGCVGFLGAQAHVNIYK